MQWLEITIQTAPGGIDPVSGKLAAMGVEDLIIDDESEFMAFLDENRSCWDYVDESLVKSMKGLSQIRFYIPDEPDASRWLSRLESELSGLKALWPDKADLGALSVFSKRLQDEDWENNWKEYYQPLPIGKRLLITPQWLTPENPENRTLVRLDPGMMFGTGAHASTQMCMLELERLIRGGETILDLGSGSGILSIAALQLGAAYAVCVDIDEKAEDIVRANAALNGFYESRLCAVTGDIIQDDALRARLAEKSYSLVLANIVADVIIPLSHYVREFLEPGGFFVCSGILDSRLPEVELEMSRSGLCVISRQSQEDWVQLTAILPTADML